MDIRSMLHDVPAPAKPPLQPVPEQSFQQRPPSHSAHPSHDQSYRGRPSYGPPLQPPDPRSPQNGGGYFSVQSPSPYQNSAASAGTHSFASQSPGGQSQLNTPRDVYPPHQQHYGQPYQGQSPSMHVQPQTPGGQQQYNHFTHPAPSPVNGPSQSIIYHTSQSSREQSTPTNGTPNPHSRHISPETQYHHQLATPLGPPASFPKPLPQNQRPSLGLENQRNYSTGSISSLTTREPGHGHMPSPEQLRRGSIHRQTSMDQDRERSVSVSPKTIPRPSPFRQPSTESHLQSQLTPPMAHAAENGVGRPSPGTAIPMQSYQQTPPPSMSFATSREQQTPSQPSSARPSASPAVSHLPPPQPVSASPSAKPTPQPVPQEQPSLKRTASVLSATSTTSQPARKRLRRDEIPNYAKSARPNNPPKLSHGQGGFVQARIKHEPRTETSIPLNGNAVLVKAPTSEILAAPPHDSTEGAWESSIMNIIPYEELTRRVSHWIMQTIGQAAPPSGGAMFEIEAKLGEICDADDGVRLDLPVETETVFNKNKYKRTKFESTMNVAQHKKINEFLNDLVAKIHHDPSRLPLYHSHPHESDEFYELKHEGRASLPPSIAHWLDRRNAPKVRITTDLKTNTKKAQIIKSRIADLEIYNPQFQFDIRISISIESPWEGRMDHLEPIGDGSNDRMKDRMSYRHGPYQIDLTQISYTGGQKPQQHELEVEMSQDLLRRELDNVKAGRPSRYEDLVRGFIDNVRILCRTATL